MCRCMKDSARPLKVRCGIRLQDVSSRSSMYCKLQNDWSCLSSTSNSYCIRLTSGEFEGQVYSMNSVMFLKPSMNNVCSVAGHTVLLRILPLSLGDIIVMMVCTELQLSLVMCYMSKQHLHAFLDPSITLPLPACLPVKVTQILRAHFYTHELTV